MGVDICVIVTMIVLLMIFDCCDLFVVMFVGLFDWLRFLDYLVGCLLRSNVVYTEFVLCLYCLLRVWVCCLCYFVFTPLIVLF